jgi:predicted alpha/beta-fold hydrolase
MHSSSTSKIQSVFRPRRWLRGGHLQTLAGNFLKRPNGLPEPEERLFQVEDDVQVLCHCHWQPDGSRQRTMTLMLVHGLEGSSNSGYVLGTGGKAWARGWNVVRMNIRNCGGTENLTPTLYHSGLSGDIRGVISTLIEQDNLQNVGVAGFSMGGNQVLKCIGEWGSEAPKELVAAAAISPAADLSLSADVIHRPANRMYEWWFMRGLRARLRRKAALFPGKYDVSLLAKANSIRNFDEHITARYMGFEGAEDYYTKASSSRVLDRIAIPTLVIHADDDPFIKLSPETISRFESNPNIHFIYTEHGGHCAFLAEPNGYDGRWAENQIVDFLQARMKRSK